MAHSNSKHALAAGAPGHSRRSFHDDHDTGRSLRRGKAVLVPDDQWYRRSAVVPGRERLAATPAAAPPSPRPRGPSWPTSGLKAFRFLGQLRFGGQLGAPFFGLLGGGRYGAKTDRRRPAGVSTAW